MCCTDITVTVTKFDHLRCEMLCRGYSRKMRGHGLTPKDALIQETAQRDSSRKSSKHGNS